MVWILSSIIAFFITGMILMNRAFVREARKVRLEHVQEVQSVKEAMAAQTRTLREELLKAEGHILALSKNLGEERKARLDAVRESGNYFRKPFVVMGASALAVGALLGGLITGLGVTAAANRQYAEIEARAQVAEQKAEFFKEQFADSRTAYDTLSRKLMNEMEYRIIAETKLGMITSNLVPGKGGRFVLDVDRMQNYVDSARNVKAVQTVEPVTTPL